MPKCVIDGREVEFTPGENVVEVAKRAGIEIPVFCYHPGLTVVAQCRMCAVEIEKMPKIQTACSTKAAEGMVIKTQSENVKKARSSVMEFLLVNHPLDCPICDKSGECDLQDNSYKFGSQYMRTTEERRTYIDLDMGPVIQKNMNRCIHCTRCIRFGDEIAGIHEMVALKRGNNTEISTIDGKPLETDYAGCYADVCPTGSLTLKDFRFHKRAWFLKKTATICEGCSRGCNMEMQHENNIPHRCIPRVNMDINKYWMCDEGRFNFHYINDESRITQPLVLNGGEQQSADWGIAISRARAALAGKKAVVLVGTDLTQEEGKILLEFLPKYLKGTPVFHFGTPGVTAVADDAPADRILKRKSKTANLHGIEKLGFKGLSVIPSGTEAVLVIRGGRAQIPDLTGVKNRVGIGVFEKTLAEDWLVVLPGQAFAEKNGTVINFEGKEQKYKKALNPPENTKPLSETLMLWMNSQMSGGVS